jgi:FkbM family methyltransferase
MGQDIYEDISTILRTATPVIFDVGANTGQTIAEMKRCFPASTIHAFEPSPRSFDSLKRFAQSATLNNMALGSKPGRMILNENSVSTMTSFLPLGRDGWGSIEQLVLPVEISTVDAYCEARGIGHIDCLKSDTQGFDLEVLRGTERMLREHRVSLIYIEITFSKMYENAPRADELFAFLADHGFDFVSFYKMWFKRGRADWTDALFRVAD